MNLQKKYLTINQLAAACSTSRSTLLRMENDKILSPAYINPENGYRYYDETSVLRVSRNLSLQEMGITHKELQEYYADSDNYDKLLEKLTIKMTMMEYHIGNLRLQLKKDEHLSISDFFFPELYCYTNIMRNVTNLTSVRPHIWNVFYEAIQKGYSVDRKMHPFVLVDYQNITMNNYDNIGYDYEICIPVLPKKDNAELKHFDAINSISTILYGGPGDMQKAFENLSNEITAKTFNIDGQARVIAVVNSFPGENIPLEYWVTRVCIPILSVE